MDQLGRKMANKEILRKAFTGGLMKWHREQNRREMPWKGEPDPYRIWLSEIILQQTRVEQGLGYYLRFTAAFPDIFSLAAAADSEVFKLWEGLGYYSRCRNLLHTARTIVSSYGGLFPPDYEKLLKLKGIGPYTAAAIASFGFGLPYAVVDGNVIRVLSRFFNEETAFDTPAGKKIFQETADKVLDRLQPGAFNQAIMDFGAMVCKPAAPLCRDCPLAGNCLGNAAGKVQDLPAKLKKAARKSRYFVFLILLMDDKVWIRERTGKDIWRHLHEFFAIEVSGEEELSRFNAGSYCGEKGWTMDFAEEVPGVFEQALTHQQVRSRFIKVHLKDLPLLPGDGKWVETGKINAYAFPRTFTRLLSAAGILSPH